MSALTSILLAVLTISATPLATVGKDVTTGDRAALRSAGGAGSQATWPAAAERGDPRLERADSLFRAGAGLRAVELALETAKAQQRDGATGYEALWRASSYALGMGVEEEARGAGSGQVRRALELARAAREADPNGVEARYWEVAALGRLALGAGVREASEYGERIRDGALWILEVDPDHAGAHHALGRLYLEIMGVSGVSRFLGRTFTGSRALDEASWERAERHLRRASEMAPDTLLFRLDLARLHQARGRESKARTILVDLAGAPVHQPPDRVFRDEARDMLRDLS